MILVEENNGLRGPFLATQLNPNRRGRDVHFVGLKVDSTKHGLVNKLELQLDILNRCSIQLHITTHVKLDVNQKKVPKAFSKSLS